MDIKVNVETLVKVLMADGPSATEVQESLFKPTPKIGKAKVGSLKHGDRQWLQVYSYIARHKKRKRLILQLEDVEPEASYPLTLDVCELMGVLVSDSTVRASVRRLTSRALKRFDPLDPNMSTEQLYTRAQQAATTALGRTSVAGKPYRLCVARVLWTKERMGTTFGRTKRGTRIWLRLVRWVGDVRTRKAIVEYTALKGEPPTKRQLARFLGVPSAALDLPLCNAVRVAHPDHPEVIRAPAVAGKKDLAVAKHGKGGGVRYSVISLKITSRNRRNISDLAGA